MKHIEMIDLGRGITAHIYSCRVLLFFKRFYIYITPAELTDLSKEIAQFVLPNKERALTLANSLIGQVYKEGDDE